ncbi:alpha/beta hydrolase [Diaphorobacter aerolatus]|uniref:Alpha/beta fold hydrolase n=1 Tax=Diaphorobacter aerolatus TaxID=1288495 RepID=A0A7H0GMW3_9BURK|nr:alpha/beta fold hydrolase [Diaphorobacter aerolatus]QNP49629.1 alpha/beta fold hydrolase [Diaphorobacter aerolatus]
MKKRWIVASCALATTALTTGAVALDAKQRQWIFQPSDRAWGGNRDMSGLEDVWIPLSTSRTGGEKKLHALWMPAASADAPVMLYLHGARWNVSGSVPRIRRMQSLGFSVLAVDYRGFGQSSNELPSEASALEDAQLAWQWLAQRAPHSDRYIFGHSLGGAVAIQLAAKVRDERGTIVEGTFTSISDVVSTFKWGWLPVSALITQRFDSLSKVAQVQSPLLVVHGSDDKLIPADLGRRLYEAAPGPKRFVLVEGGTHHNTNSLGIEQYRNGLRELFELKL